MPGYRDRNTRSPHAVAVLWAVASGWRLGAVEMGLDCLRRYLQGLPVHERIDSEKTDDKP